MTEPDPAVVVVGLGEMGSVFARGVLRTGRTVTPALRGTDLGALAASVSEPELVIIAVAEADLEDTLASIPDVWKHRLCLLQNELVPRLWRRHGITDPTVAVVWFEKKRGMDTKVIISSPVGGPRAGLIVEALATLDLPSHPVDGELERELLVKNLYILTANIAGLETGGTVMELWESHHALARVVAGEVLEIQEHLFGRFFDAADVIAAMEAAFAADPDHGATGRSAPARLRRAIFHADEAGLAVPTLRRLAAEHLD